jgi:hypothetical protein
MELTEDFEPIVLLNDAENFTGLGNCQLILLTKEEAEHIADHDDLPMVKARLEVVKRTYDLEDVVRWAFANGYTAGASPPR